jgi:hypothetical protein
MIPLTIPSLDTTKALIIDSTIVSPIAPSVITNTAFTIFSTISNPSSIITTSTTIQQTTPKCSN